MSAKDFLKNFERLKFKFLKKARFQTLFKIASHMQLSMSNFTLPRRNRMIECSGRRDAYRERAGEAGILPEYDTS